MKNLRRKIFHKITQKIIIFATVFLPFLVFAEPGNDTINIGGVTHLHVDFIKMAQNLLPNIAPLVRLVFAVSYVMGIWFIYSAIRELRAYGEARVMMPSQASFGPPMIRLFVGGLLMFAPGMVDVSTYSLWGYGARSIIAYPNVTGEAQWEPVVKACIAIIRLVGYISFTRGLTLVAKGAKQGAQPGLVGKGITHLVGGILAINIVGTIDVLKTTLGIFT